MTTDVFFYERRLIMGLVMYGGGITQISGRIGGDVHARNRYGNYIRAGTKPTNPNTALQIQYRSAVAALVARWSDTLTALQRAAWNLYASSVAMKNKLGQTIYLSGFNHYIRSNVMLARLGYTIVDAGPTIFEIPAHDPSFAITASEATQQITTVYDDTMAWADETGGYLFLFQGHPQNAQRNYFKGPWRNYGEVAGITGAAPPSPHIGAVQLAIAEGQRQWTYARILRADGRLSETFGDDTFCAA